MEVPDGRPHRLVTGLPGRRDLFRRRRRQCLRRERGRRAGALEAPHRRSRAFDTGGRRQHRLCGQLRRQVLRARREDRRVEVEVQHRRRAAIRGERVARPATEESDDRGCLRRLPVESRRRWGLGVLRQRRRACLLARCRFRHAQLEIPYGRRGPCLARVCRWRPVLRQLGQLLLRGRRQDGRRKMALSRWGRSAHSQPGRLSVVTRGRERGRLYGLQGLEAVRDRRRHRPREVAFRHRRKLGGELALRSCKEK